MHPATHAEHDNTLEGKSQKIGWRGQSLQVTPTESKEWADSEGHAITTPRRFGLCHQQAMTPSTSSSFCQYQHKHLSILHQIITPFPSSPRPT